MWSNRGRIFTIIAAALLVGAMALPATAQDPDELRDESWITMSGTVTSVSDHEFELDYGVGVIRVEMDDWNDDADARVLREGNMVTVTGKFEDEIFETTSIEAATVYVKELDKHFYANPQDEEGDPGATFSDRMITAPQPFEASTTTVIGTVKSVEGHQFTIDAGIRELTIDTSQLETAAMDSEDQVEVGDRVRVTGKIGADFFDGQRLAADTVTTLSTTS